MENLLSRRIFLSKTSKGIVGVAVISVAGSGPFYLVAGTKKIIKDKSLISKSICEFGVEGSAPGKLKHLICS